MNTFTRRIALFGVLSALLATAACAQTRAMQPNPALAKELAPTGRLRAAINVGNTVLAQRGATEGEAGGVSVEIAREVGRRLGVPVDLTIYPAAGMVVDALATKPWDIAFLGADPGRGADIAFTFPYVYIDGTYMVRADSPYRAVADLDRPGVRISVGRGAAYDLYLTRELKNAQLVRVQTSLDAIALFNSGGVDAVAGVRQALVDAQAKTPGPRVLPDSYTRIEQAVAIPKGREAGFAYVSAVLDELKATGFIRASLDRSGQTGATVAPPRP